jgi:hypothetical protein
MLLTKMIYQLITESKNMKMQTAKDSMGITYFPSIAFQAMDVGHLSAAVSLHNPTESGLYPVKYQHSPIGTEFNPINYRQNSIEYGICLIDCRHNPISHKHNPIASPMAEVGANQSGLAPKQYEPYNQFSHHKTLSK